MNSDHTTATRTELHAAITAAAASWYADCSGWCSRVLDCGEPPVFLPGDPVDLYDGVSWILWLADWSIPGIDSNTIALTLSWTDATGAREDTDEIFNDHDFVWIVGPPSSRQEVDTESIAVHELGHSLGLGHYDDSVLRAQLCADTTRPQPAVMCSSYRFDGLARIPTADDLDGLCTLYPISELGACELADAGDPDGGAPDGGYADGGDADGGADGGYAGGGDAAGGGDDDDLCARPPCSSAGCECSSGVDAGTSGVLGLAGLGLGARRRGWRAGRGRRP